MNAHEMRRGVRRNWREHKVLVKGQKRPGLAVQEIVRVGTARNRTVRIDRLDSWLVVFDEVTSWYLSLFTICYGAMKTRRGRVSRALAHSTTILISKIFADLLAIRRLVVDGFDVAAQTVLRSTIEHIEVLALLLIRPDLAVEFERTDDNQTSNQFWNKHLRRGKIRKLLRDELRVRLGEEAAVDLDEVIYQDRDGLSMTSHPSMVGGFIAYVSPGDPMRDNWPGIFGARADDSWHTLYSVVSLTFALWLICLDAPFDSRGNRVSLAKYDASNELHRHVRQGSRALIHLVLELWSQGEKHCLFDKVDVSHIWPNQNGTARGPT